MSTATTTVKPLPEHYERTMDDADRMGWDVVTTPTSVKLTPPSGRKNDQIVLDLKTPLVPPQLRNKLIDEGFIKALQAWDREQKSKAQPEPKAPAKAPAQQDGKDVLVCEACVEKGVAEPYTTERSQSMGAHKRKAHNIAGSSPEAVRLREKNAAKGAPARKTPSARKATSSVKKTASAKKTVSVKKTAAEVPAQRAAEPVKLPQLPLPSGLPAPVATHLNDLVTAIKAELGSATTLKQEIEPLREFFDKVDELVGNPNLTPLKVLATIQDLVMEIKQK